MCGRYTITNASQLALRFDAALNAEDVPLESRYNIAPTQEVPVIVPTAEGRAAQWMRWGFQPAWRKDDSRGPAPINARAETLLERPMFRSALTRHRCLIPADGFYEWQEQAGKRTKQPYHIRLRNGGLFAFAGIYTFGPGDAAGCAIITTAPNALMAPIHNRMPAILDPELEALWLDPSYPASDAVLSCLRPYAADSMEAFPVSALVSSVRNDGPELLRH